MESKIQKLSKELAAIKGSIHPGGCVAEILARDIAGTWFHETLKTRVRVNDSGKCFFDNGSQKQVEVDGSCLKLDDGFVLSMQKSSRKELLGEGGPAGGGHMRCPADPGRCL